jgi:hypothetical protein
MQRTIAATGGQEKFQAEWLANVDPDVVQGFAKMRLL